MYALSVHHLHRLPYEWRPDAPIYQVRLALAMLEVEREEREAAREAARLAGKAPGPVRSAHAMAARGARALASFKG